MNMNEIIKIKDLYNKFLIDEPKSVQSKSTSKWWLIIIDIIFFMLAVGKCLLLRSGKISATADTILIITIFIMYTYTAIALLCYIIYHCLILKYLNNSSIIRKIFYVIFCIIFCPGILLIWLRKYILTKLGFIEFEDYLPIIFFEYFVITVIGFVLLLVFSSKIYTYIEVHQNLTTIFFDKKSWLCLIFIIIILTIKILFSLTSIPIVNYIIDKDNEKYKLILQKYRLLNSIVLACFTIPLYIIHTEGVSSDLVDVYFIVTGIFSMIDKLKADVIKLHLEENKTED